MTSRLKTTRVSRSKTPAACSRVEATYRQLKHDILAGVYTPRQRLVETDMAPALGVSRATLRAVLVLLQHEGLVEIQPNRGARVRAFSVEEAAENLQVREVLEGLAAALAAQQVTAEQLATLRNIVMEMETTLASGDLLGLLPLASRFHQIIIDAAAQTFITQLLNMLQAPLIRHQFRIIMVPGRKEAALSEFRAILDRIEARDAAGAEQAMRRHMAALRKGLQKASRLPIG